MNRTARLLRSGFRAFGLDPLVRRVYYYALTMFPEIVAVLIGNPLLRLRGAPDGLPIPSVRLAYLVTGRYDLADSYYAGGVRGADSIRSILAANGLDIGAFHSILDFGCGCGRIIRHWRNLGVSRLSGSDCSASAIMWCRRSFPFAEFKLNEPGTGLDYDDDQFDFIYAISVFTHLSEAGQFFWMNELTRILKPGGYLLITVQGTRRLHVLQPHERQRFQSGQLVVVNPMASGTNDCYVFHPEQYVRSSLSRGLTVADFVPGGAKDNNQDVFLLTKPVETASQNTSSEYCEQNAHRSTF